MRSPLGSSRAAFTIVELLVATAILSLMVVMLIGATDQAGKLARRTTGKVEQFSEARLAFEKMTRRLSEATLNTYWDYEYKQMRYAGGVTVLVAKSYIRQSDMRFRTGHTDPLTRGDGYRPTHGVFFQAPVGQVEDVRTYQLLEQSVNTWGYFLEVGNDDESIPTFLRERQPVRYRSRLMELREPTERLSIYRMTRRDAQGKLLYEGSTDDWFVSPIRMSGTDRPVRVMGENIIALIIRPRLSRQDELALSKQTDGGVAGEVELSPNFSYDSTVNSNYVPPLGNTNKNFAALNPKNQLPPTIQVAMVAIDEATAARLTLEHPGDPTLGLKTEDLFQEASKLEDNPATSAPGDGDLQILEQRLIEKRAAYRIFNTTVSVRGAKWSRSQTF